MPAKKLKEFLNNRGVKYESIQHPLTYTAPEIAASAHVSGSDFAKTVIVKLDGQMAMVVVPAHRKIALAELRDLLSSDQVELATEDEFMSRFPDCELGAMPPSGNLYDMPVYIERSLSEHPEIAFNAGTHREVIKMAWDDFTQLVNPIVMALVTV